MKTFKFSPKSIWRVNCVNMTRLFYCSSFPFVGRYVESWLHVTMISACQTNVLFSAGKVRGKSERQVCRFWSRITEKHCIELFWKVLEQLLGVLRICRVSLKRRSPRWRSHLDIASSCTAFASARLRRRLLLDCSGQLGKSKEILVNNN